MQKRPGLLNDVFSHELFVRRDDEFIVNAI